MNPIADTADTRSRTIVGLALAALMAATRGQEFAPLGQHLPDASLAVFFLAGFYLQPLKRSFGAFVALLALATLIDVSAIRWGGVSAFCLTPAYALLVPTYGLAWLGGRWYAERHSRRLAALPLLAGTLLVVGLGAEAIASGGFYLVSGRFAQPSLLGFGHSLVDYLPQTLMALYLYVALAAVLAFGLTYRQAEGQRALQGPLARR